MSTIDEAAATIAVVDPSSSVLYLHILCDFLFFHFHPSTTQLWGTIIVNRTCGTHKTYIYIQIFTNAIWSYLLWSPVILILIVTWYIGIMIQSRIDVFFFNDSLLPGNFSIIEASSCVYARWASITSGTLAWCYELMLLFEPHPGRTYEFTCQNK